MPMQLSPWKKWADSATQPFSAPDTEISQACAFALPWPTLCIGAGRESALPLSWMIPLPTSTTQKLPVPCSFYRKPPENTRSSILPAAVPAADPAELFHKTSLQSFSGRPRIHSLWLDPGIVPKDFFIKFSGLFTKPAGTVFKGFS